MFPLDSIMYEGMGLPFNQTHQPLYVSWCWWCWLFRLMLVASKLIFEESLVYRLFVSVLRFRYGLHFVLFWLYALLLSIYMRNFAYLCKIVWILMDAHEYFFSKFEYFMYNLIDRFCGLIFVWFWFLRSVGSMTGPVLVTFL